MLPSCITATGYAVAFYFLSLTVKNILVGITYAIWPGIGIVFIILIGIIVSGKYRIFRFHRDSTDPR